MKHLHALILIILPLSGFSQDTTGLIHILGKNWLKGNIYASASYSKDKYYRENYSFNELKEDSKNSDKFYNFPSADFNEYGNFSPTSFVYHLSLSFHPVSRKNLSVRKNHELRIGLGYYKGIDNSIDFANKYHHQLYGTVTDTSYISYISYHQLLDQLGIDFTYIIRSNPFFHRFSLFGGIGAGINWSVYSKVEETLHEFSVSTVCVNTGSGTVCYNVNTELFHTKLYGNSTAFTYRSIFPYGIDYRLAKHLNLFFEGRTGLSLHKYVGGKLRFKSFSSLGLGVRFGF